MLNKEEIKQKKKDIINMLKKNNNPQEESRLRQTLISLMRLETENEDLVNVKLNKTIDKVLGGSLSLRKAKKREDIKREIPIKLESIMDDYYFLYLVQLATNIKKMKVFYKGDNRELKSLKLTDEEKVKLSKEFYKKLGSPIINELAQKVLNDSSHYGFTDEFSYFLNGRSYGITIFDYVFNKPYTTVRRLNTIMGCQAFNHEIMHCIDFYVAPSYHDSVYYGFDEIPTYTIDYLFQDFLESKGFNPIEVDALRRQKQNYMGKISDEIVKEIAEIIAPTPKPHVITLENASAIRRIMDPYILDKMIHLEASIIAYGIYKIILVDKEKGLEILQEIMKNKPPRGKIPDFSFVGFDRRTIVDLSETLGKQGNEEIINKGYRK